MFVQQGYIKSVLFYKGDFMKFNISLDFDKSSSSEKIKDEKILRLQDEITKLKEENFKRKNYIVLLIAAFTVASTAVLGLLGKTFSFFFSEIINLVIENRTISAVTYCQSAIMVAVSCVLVLFVYWTVQQILK